MDRSKRTVMLSFIENKAIKKEYIHKALRESEVIPASKSWYHFIDQLLLWSAGLVLAFSMLFFIAYNWTALGRFGKFALVEGSIVLSIILYSYIKESLFSKILLMISSVLVGVLLALVGQTYQTGADPWQLFFYWALLILPWVTASRSAMMWMVWIFLINISIFLYMEVHRGFFGFRFYTDSSLIWILFFFNTCAWILWEFFSIRFVWLAYSWSIRLLSLMSTFAITLLAVYFIRGNSSVLALLVWTIWSVGLYILYRVRQIDLFMLAMLALSFSLTSISFLVQLLFAGGFHLGSVLLIGLVILGFGGGFAVWFKSLQKEAVDAA